MVLTGCSDDLFSGSNDQHDSNRIPLQGTDKQLSILLSYDIVNQALNYHHFYISKQLRIPPQAVPSRTTRRGL